MKAATDILASAQEAIGPVCNRETGTEAIPLSDLVNAILMLAEKMSEKVFFTYQREIATRIIEAVLLREADMLTALLARQSGKTEILAAVVSALMIILPELAKQFPTDWRFNLTDELGRYRGYREGITIGIYAPIQDQANLMFDRISTFLDTRTAAAVLSEAGLKFHRNRGNCIRLSNGSEVLSMSASKNSNIEGHTHQLLITEETQDIDTMKIRKSIHPMTAATKGVIVKIGTASTHKGDFYHSIKANMRLEAITGKKNHFFFPYQRCIQENSLYADYIRAEKFRIGEQSDEFRMSYECQWLLERGMFFMPQTLMSRNVAITSGKYSMIHQAYRAPNLVVGIDWGRETDSTVVTVVEADWETPAVEETIERNMMDTTFTAYFKHVIAWREYQGDDYEYQFSEILEWLQNFSTIRKITLDATREAAIADRIAHHPMFADVEIEDFVFNTATKASGYRLFQSDVLSGRFTFPAGQEARKAAEYRRFVGQCLDLQKTYQNGYLCVAHPEESGAHDDFPVSAMLANWGGNTPSASKNIQMLSGGLLI